MTYKRARLKEFEIKEPLEALERVKTKIMDKYNDRKIEREKWKIFNDSIENTISFMKNLVEQKRE